MTSINDRAEPAHSLRESARWATQNQMCFSDHRSDTQISGTDVSYEVAEKDGVGQRIDGAGPWVFSTVFCRHTIFEGEW